jgi:RNA polymerase sigma-70 factor, ECF subfamily
VGADSQDNQWPLLMRAANLGDAEAYRKLLLQLTPVLRSLARRGLARAGLAVQDAEDIVQETLLAIHLKSRVGMRKHHSAPGFGRSHVIK